MTADDDNVNVDVAVAVVDIIVVTELLVYVHNIVTEFCRDCNLNLSPLSKSLHGNSYVYTCTCMVAYYITACIIASLLAKSLFNQNP